MSGAAAAAAGCKCVFVFSALNGTIFNFCESLFFMCGLCFFFFLLDRENISQDQMHISGFNKQNIDKKFFLKHQLKEIYMFFLL